MSISFQSIKPTDLQEKNLTLLNQMFKDLFNEVSRLGGNQGPIKLASSIDMQGNPISNLGKPAGTSDALSQDAATPLYGPQGLVSSLAPTGGSAVSAIKQFNDLGQGVEIIHAGYYINADVVPLQTSGKDGYTFQRPETIYILIHASSLTPVAIGFTSGQPSFPTALQANLGAGNLLASPYVLKVQRSNQANPGTLTIQNYYSVSGAVNEGTIDVYAVCARGATWG